MNEMIERVARAIYETEPFEINLHKTMPWADVDESQKEGFRIKARAAIDAMDFPIYVSSNFSLMPTNGESSPSSLRKYEIKAFKL